MGHWPLPCILFVHWWKVMKNIIRLTRMKQKCRRHCVSILSLFQSFASNTICQELNFFICKGNTICILFVLLLISIYTNDINHFLATVWPNGKVYLPSLEARIQTGFLLTKDPEKWDLLPSGLVLRKKVRKISNNMLWILNPGSLNSSTCCIALRGSIQGFGMNTGCRWFMCLIVNTPENGYVC